MIEWEESPLPSEQFELNIADCCAMIQNIKKIKNKVKVSLI